MSTVSHDYSVHVASPADAAALTALLRRAKTAWGYPSEWLQAWEHELTISAEYIERERVMVLQYGLQVLGFYGLDLKAPDAVLEHLWVDPDHMRHGIGSKLLLRRSEVKPRII